MTSYFEDVAVGATAVLGRHTFSREEIVAFARAFDPQPFHLDEDAARRSPFGALCASGWHTAATWMKYFVAHKGEPAMPAGQLAGASPGFRNLRWLKPVYVGDTITFATRVKEKTTSRTRAEWGIVHSYNTGTNQHGDLVFDFEGAVMLPRRG